MSKSNTDFLNEALAANGMGYVPGQNISPLNALSALDWLADKCYALSKSEKNVAVELDAAGRERVRLVKMIEKLQAENSQLKADLAEANKEALCH